MNLINMNTFEQTVLKELTESQSTISQLRNEVDQLSRSLKEKDRTIVQLRRELIDIDTQLDSERRKRTAMKVAFDKVTGNQKKEIKVPESPPPSAQQQHHQQQQQTSFRLSTKTPPVSPPHIPSSRKNNLNSQLSSNGAGLNSPHENTQSLFSAGEESSISRMSQSSSSRVDRSNSTRSGSAPHSRIIRARPSEEGTSKINFPPKNSPYETNIQHQQQQYHHLQQQQQQQQQSQQQQQQQQLRNYQTPANHQPITTIPSWEVPASNGEKGYQSSSRNSRR